MSLLVSLQQQCADRLQSDSLFAHVPVLTERIKYLQSEIATALGPLNGQGGKTGLVAIVLTPTADVHFDHLFGPFFDDIKIVVRVIEHVTVNQDSATGTNVPAADLAEKICNLLHQFQPENANGPIVARKPSIALRRDPSHLVYECRFRTCGGLTSVLSQVATPAISKLSGTITVTCATAGAAMFYTLDGSAPAPRNGTLYTGPFAPGAGLRLNVRGWLAGYLASEVATQTT